MVNCFDQFPYTFARMSQVEFFGKHLLSVVPTYQRLFYVLEICNKRNRLYPCPHGDYISVEKTSNKQINIISGMVTAKKDENKI